MVGLRKGGKVVIHLWTLQIPQRLDIPDCYPNRGSLQSACCTTGIYRRSLHHCWCSVIRDKLCRQFIYPSGSCPQFQNDHAKLSSLCNRMFYDILQSNQRQKDFPIRKLVACRLLQQINHEIYFLKYNLNYSGLFLQSLNYSTPSPHHSEP